LHHDEVATEGALADASQSLLLEGLTHAAAEPGGVPLLASRGAAGLFAANAAGKRAAVRCRDDGLVQVLRTETRGKSSQEICAITEKGLALLLQEANPRQLLESFVEALDARRTQMAQLLDSARQSQDYLETLRGHAEKVLAKLHRPCESSALFAIHKNGANGKHHETATVMVADPGAAAVLDHLRRWNDAARLGDCPLPEIFRVAKEAKPGTTIGQFHDLLRRLHEERRIYLHPWTGPLYELPEPAVALLTGHEVAFYASLRNE